MTQSLKDLIFTLSDYESFGILGFGKEGKSFLDFCEKNISDITNKKIFIFDKYLTQEKITEYIDKKSVTNSNFKNLNIVLFSGEEYKTHFKKAEIIIKAPGISCFHENISDSDIEKYNITSLSDLFLRFFGHQTIGITGTKGKSTTSSLLHYLFSCAGRKSFLVGNIGNPVFSILEKITNESIIIHEFSSHQLEKITVGPKVAILLNLFPEHLDYYKNEKAYFDAKKNIFKCGSNNKNNKKYNEYISIENAHFTVATDFKDETNLEYKFPRRKYYFNNEKEGTEQYLDKIHNISVHQDTIRVSKIISDIYELFPIENNGNEEFIKCVNSFVSLPHRLEILKGKNKKNITYVNDSISTIPESTIEGVCAIKKLEKIENKTLETLILGGFDRGVSLDKLIDFVNTSDIKNIFLFAETGKILEKSFTENNTGNKTIIYKEKLEDIIPFVSKYSSKDSICLFSPSASSFDQYKNFEERGNHFRALAESIEKNEN